LADYNAYGASIGCGLSGTTFTFTIGPTSAQPWSPSRRPASLVHRSRVGVRR